MPTIKLRNGSGVPTNGTLAAGEPALDLTNRKLYTSTNGTDIVEVAANTDSGGTVTSVSGGNGLTGTVTTSGSLNVGAGTGISVTADAVALATAGAGAGTYGSTSDGTKIDQITLDAYGRVTAITTGATGSSSTTGTVTSVTGGNGLTGSVTTSGSLAVGAGAGMHVNADDVSLYSVFTAGGTQTIQDEEFIVVTTAGQTITLPASPSAGDTVYISVGNFTDTQVSGNGQDIMADPSNLTIDVANVGITLVYYNTTYGWRLM